MMPIQREQSVLVVDDESSILRLIATWLEAAGYKVAGTALDGEEALELFRENDRVDLVISDVVMPQLSGPDMVPEMLRDAPDLKVLFITGYTDRTVEERIAELPFEGVRKPFTPEHLLARVREAPRVTELAIRFVRPPPNPLSRLEIKQLTPILSFCNNRPS